MSKMNKIIAIAIMFTMMGLGFNAMAADTDTFTITVTVKYTAVVLVQDVDGVTAFADWSIGTVALNTATAMGTDQGVQTVITSNVACDIETWVSDPGNWAVAATPGAEQFKLEAKSNGTKSTYAAATGANVVLTGATQDVAANVASGNPSNYFVYYQFTTPTSVTSLAQASGGSITVTVKVSPTV